MGRGAQKGQKVRRYFQPPALSDPNGSWRDRAACRDMGTGNPVFFLKSRKPRAREEAKAICSGCPVQANCEQFITETEPLDRNRRFGVWAGLDENERHLIARVTGRSS